MQAGDGEGGSDRPDTFWQVCSEREGLTEAAGAPVCQHHAQGTALVYYSVNCLLAVSCECCCMKTYCCIILTCMMAKTLNDDSSLQY